MSLIDRRVRGFRLIDVIAFALLVMLVMSVYLAKTMASRERAQIARVEQEISAEKSRIRLLEAEVAHLEQPSRIERLSTDYLEMAPVAPKQEATLESLYALSVPEALP